MEELGEQFGGITRQRVSQILAKENENQQEQNGLAQQPE
jgi:hypothetical protein|tara:strand:+ start:127 stop:243 length:117 start_codon:yes stop_codon:yes gene_type:complete